LTLESFVNSPLVNIGSLALAVLGVLLAVIFYFRSQKNKTPCFECNSNTLVEGLYRSLDGLEIHYKGAAQERVTISKVIFWNAGRDTIDGQDLVKKDPLRIVCPQNVEILDIQIVSDNAELNSIRLGDSIESEDGVSYPISFEYLDHEEYFVIQVIHNGDSSEKFIVDGKIKGVKSINRVSEIKLNPKILRFIPFSWPMEKLISSPVYLKYIGSLMYLSFGFAALWNIFYGDNHWYLWVVTGFCFIMSGVLYYEFRHISPIKI
jgi:hypothetical protein